MMTIRQQVLDAIQQLPDEQLTQILPVLRSLQQRQETWSSEASKAYQDWLGADNDVYDQLFNQEVSTRLLGCIFR